ncbi:MAG TPA: M64 family metallopeptidase [Bacteroidota bacterium]|nr:M64 family metallopeptidase [Bacteroidota bacterium]
MRRSVVAVCALCLLARAAAPGAEYGSYFTDRTLRVDLYHTGTKGVEQYALDRAFLEGPWAGHRVNLIDTLNLGEYLLSVTDRATNLPLYSRGFSTLFSEWQTTDEALAGVTRTFAESVRFPAPRRAVRIAIARRDRRMEFHEFFSCVIDPADPAQVVAAHTRPAPHVEAILQNGPPAVKVDIAILGDGYAAADMEKFRRDAARFTDDLFRTHPFRERKQDFNVWRVDVVSEESGIDIPGRGVWKRHALGARYDTFGSARYVLTEDNRAIRDAAAAAPYDFLCILVNDTRYGGGGIYNLYATTYTNEQTPDQQWQMDYVFVHEFGHSFAGLADEYYTSSTGYNDFYLPGVEPWEPNITAASGPAGLKWRALVTPGVPLPTPWGKAEYDSLEALRGKLDRLAADYYAKREPFMRQESAILENSPYRGNVGLFEGAGYVAKGLYRPCVDCRMFSLSLADFDPVCSAAIVRMIGFYSDPAGR